MGYVSGGAASAQPNMYTPDDVGLLAWTFDLALATAQIIQSDKVTFLTKVPVKTDISVTKVLLHQTATPALTAGQSWVGLYTRSGTTATKVADVDVSGITWQNGQPTVISLGTTVEVAADTDLLVATLFGGTTRPTLRTSPATNGQVNADLASGQFRAFENYIQRTTLPATFTTTVQMDKQQMIWIGLA